MSSPLPPLGCSERPLTSCPALAGIGVKCCALVGGIDMMAQAIALAKRPHVLVGTPGRVVDHLSNTKGFSLRALKHLVLDEADRLLNMVRRPAHGGFASPRPAAEPLPLAHAGFRAGDRPDPQGHPEGAADAALLGHDDQQGGQAAAGVPPGPGQG